jgi:hypothetical protein
VNTKCQFVTEQEMPILYLDWAEWRLEQISMSMMGPLVDPGSCFCLTCAGNGRVYEPAANGEGLIPTCPGPGVRRNLMGIRPATLER